MKKELLRPVLCLMLFPVFYASAQDTRTAPDATMSKKTDAQTTQDGMLAKPVEAQPDTKSALAAQAVVAATPLFPDSLMANYQVEIFQKVLKTADLANFQYKDAVAKAQTGDIAAIFNLLDFSRVVDGVDALNHAVTCLELIPLAGDIPFATAVFRCQPKMKKLLLERLMLAQGRTKKTFLRQSLTNWAPKTWTYLNGKADPTELLLAPGGVTMPQPAEAAPKASSPSSLMLDSTSTRTRRQ